MPASKNAPDSPVSFGYKCAWLAIRSDSPEAVARELGLRDLTASNWACGIQAAYSDQVFVCPPIDGWVLVAGLGLAPQTVDDMRTVGRLSKAFGEAHLYASHRVVELHWWAKAIRGEVVRAYAYLGESGEVLVDLGHQSPEEAELGFAFDGDSIVPDEESVIAIAGKWSVDPTKLEERHSEGLGLLGALPPAEHRLRATI